MIRSFITIIAALFFFLVIAGISAYFTLTRVIKSGDTVVVPNLVGKDAIYALQLLTDLGLNTKIKGSEYSSDTPLNHIMAQEPAPGEIIKKGRDIRLIISKGTQVVFVPNLQGLDLQQAQLILEENGISEGKISKTFSSQMKDGFVIAQNPAAGTKLKRGESTDLLISIGPRPVQYPMPDLKNLSLDNAVWVIEKNKLEIGKIKSVYRNSRPTNLVVGQDPPAGYYVESGRQVNLEVNQAEASGNGYRLGGGRLFRYRLPVGFLKQHIRLELRIFGFTCIIYDELMPPGREIWMLVPAQNESVIFLYKNDALIDTMIFGKSML